MARALASMNLGVIAYAIANSFGEEILLMKKKGILWFFSTLFFIIGIYLSYDPDKSNLDCLCVICFFIAITLAFSVSIGSKLFNNPVIYYFNEMTLPLYLNHYTLLFLPFRRSINFLILLSFSAIELWLVKMIRRKMGRFKAEK